MAVEMPTIDILAQYIESLAKNIPNESIPDEIDVILGGGAFNGYITIGVGMFLVELERQGKTKIVRISGVSAGALVAICMFARCFACTEKLFDDMRAAFRKTGDLSGYSLLYVNALQETLADTDVAEMNDRVFISYNDINSYEFIVQSSFESTEQLLETLNRSTYLPLLTDGSSCLDNKYIDGIIPYMFEDNLRPTIVVDILGINQMSTIFSTCGEDNPHSRIFEGVSSISNLLMKRQPGICSWRDDWGVREHIWFRFVYVMVMTACVIVNLGKKSSIVNALIASNLVKALKTCLMSLGRDLLRNCH
jgi:hypothetical protein